MKQKIIILVMLLVGLLSVQEAGAQCRKKGDWDGFTPFQGYLPTANSIKISWATNSVYAKENFKVYKKQRLTDPWVLVASNIKNSYYDVTGLTYSTTYYFLVERYCDDGSYTDNFTTGGLTTKPQAYVPPSISYCFGYWYGYTGNSPSDTSIQVNWTYDATADKDAKYIVYYRMNDHGSGTSDWQNSGELTGGTSYTATGLTKNTSYQFKIEKWCNNVRNSNISDVTIATTENPNSTYYILGPTGGISNVTQTTAQLDYMNKALLLPGTRLDGFTYYISRNGGTWEYVLYNPAISKEATHYFEQFINLIPGSNYSFVIEQKYTLSPGESWENSHVVYSNVMNFQTDPWGPCNSLTGNYTIPWANVGVNVTTNQNYKYSGTIFCTSNIILGAPILITFEATAVELKPGFVTNVGKGAFKAVAFNPANCATTKTSDSKEELVVSDATINAVATDAMLAQTGKLVIYPNPTTGLLNIQLPSSSEAIKQVLFTNELGQTVLKTSSDATSIDISNFSNGIYFYKIETNQGNYGGKIIKK